MQLFSYFIKSQNPNFIMKSPNMLISETKFLILFNICKPSKIHLSGLPDLFVRREVDHRPPICKLRDLARPFLSQESFFHQWIWRLGPNVHGWWDPICNTAMFGYPKNMYLDFWLVLYISCWDWDSVLNSRCPGRPFPRVFCWEELLYLHTA